MKIITFITLGLAVVIGWFSTGCSNDDNGSPASANNHGPVIRSVTANPNPVDRAVYGGPATMLSCVATDSDDDSLSYHWAAPSGVFPDGVIGQAVEWYSNTAGDFWVNVTVNDGKDIDVDSIMVTVR
jgi:hypothetical protein